LVSRGAQIKEKNYD